MNVPTFPSSDTAIDVQRLLHDGRSDRLDWLDDHASVAAIGAAMAAMANHRGGTLLIGISGVNTPAVTGTADPIAAIDRVLQAALSLDPALVIPLPFHTEIDRKHVVVARVPSGMPHVYALDGRYLYRQGQRNEPLSPPELRRLMIERNELVFEAEVTLGATSDDIDWDRANDYVNSLKGPRLSVDETLLRRGCLVQRGDLVCPTNAGILLFGKDPQRFIRSADITAVRFAGTAMSDKFNRQDVLGTLPDQIRRAETFLIDHLRKGVELQGTMERKEDFEYPMEAARELVVNAVAHRDYSIAGDGIRLFLFQNRMEVHSPGGLPGPVTVATIKDDRFSRNPIIVQVLSDMGFIERLGYGVDRVIELMRQRELRAPEFVETPGGFRVTLFNEPAAPGSDSESSGEAPAPLELQGEYQGIPINVRQEAALAFLNRPGNTRITNSELQRLFPDVHAETIRRDLADLVVKNILSKMGQKRGSYYILKRVDE